ncbi:uncharacterized protein LOC135701935 [Ochlerotatus camptorhynchus]|uniref:uncharacterized protein LOC135701935 n=1 Tax=Ochlerotatus camptorhynchus TaxID=644619 RepID=UPI0031D5D0D2
MEALVFLFAILAVLAPTTAENCMVIIRTDIPARDPVYLKVVNGQADLWAPNGPALIWNSTNEVTALLCSGSNNALVATDMATSHKTCIERTTFNVEGVHATSQELQCRNQITGDTINTGQSCGGRGTLLYLGFNSQVYGFIPYIHSCMDMQRASLLWTRHILPGAAVAGAMIESSRPAFKVAGMPAHVRPATSYTQASQLTRLTELLGSVEQAAKFVFTNSFMARGHMSPDADGTYRSWQFTTYFFTNVVPKWQVVNNGNWARVERVTRDTALNLHEDLVIIQGTDGILTLPHEDGRQIPITLEDGGIEAPQWLWKIIKSPKLDAGIAFVTSNNPFKTDIHPLDFICTDICSQTGWAQDEYADFARGYTYCCDPNELIANVPTASAEGRVGRVLLTTML